MPLRLPAPFRRVLDAVRGRDDPARDLDEEFRFHVDMQAEKNVRLGMAPDEARRQALVAFGGHERYRDEVRDERAGRWLEDVARDLRLAVRGLRREPGFTVSVVASLALGIGATTAVFALAYGVLLRPLPYPSSDRLVELQHTAPGFDIIEGGQSGGTYLHYRAHARAFEEIGVYFERVFSITDGDQPERVESVFVTPSVLSLLRVPAAHGRLFTAADSEQDAGGAVILSYDLWMRRYGGDPGVVGRTIEINRGATEVVGIMPPGFHFPTARTQLWYALPVGTAGNVGIRSLFMRGIARLREDVTPADAQAELARLAPSLADAYPDVTLDELVAARFRPVVTPLKELTTRDVRPALVLVLWTVAFVLLITWANVTNLCLVRAERRRREVAIARALGATTRRLIRRDLVEGLLLAAAGGTLGVFIAFATTAARFGFEAGELPRLHEVRVDGTVLSLALGLSAVSAALLALTSFAATGRRTTTVSRGVPERVLASRRGRRAHQTLVASQVALSLTLLIGAAVMAQSFWRLKHADLGFAPENVLTFEVALPTRQYPEFQDRTGFFIGLLERLRGVPGVAAAEAVDVLPLTPVAESMIGTVRRGDDVGRRGEPTREATFTLVSPGYFRAMRMSLLHGRNLQPADLVSDQQGVVLSAELARVLFGTSDVVGRSVLRGVTAPRRYAVVGVAGDVPGATIAGGPARVMYFPMLDEVPASMDVERLAPRWPHEMMVVVRTTVRPETVLPAARRIVDDLDAQIPIARVQTFDQRVEMATVRARLTAALLLMAASAALFLGIVGLYGVVAYAVTLRTAEFGLRLALGAQPTALQQLVLRQGLTVTLAGIVAGLATAVALARFLRGLTYGISPTDPATLVGAAVLLLLVALGASWLPARRAARTDPMVALRAE